MTEPQKAEVGRREFLSRIGAGATIAAIVPASPGARAETVLKDEKRGSRYRANSPHVHAFYRVNRYLTK